MAAIQFAPFVSDVELGFYAALFRTKLDYDKLDDSARPVLGLYEPRRAEPMNSCKMLISSNALTSSNVPFGGVRAEGIIKNFNTLEAFKAADKNAIIQQLGRQVWDAIKDGSIYSVPSLLSSFTIISYADLKKRKCSYWFGFPALHSDPAWKRTGPIQRLTGKESEALVDVLGTWKMSVDNREHGFFLAKKVRDSSSPSTDNGLSFRWQVGSLRDFESRFFHDTEPQDRYVAFVDPSTFADFPSWPLRNLLVLIKQRFQLTDVQILCFRDTQPRRDEGRSIILPLAMDPSDKKGDSEMPKVTGWERNHLQKLHHKVASLAEHMEPVEMVEAGVDLNLKLMKWRIAPELDLDIIKNTRCLLIGAGTLGGYVSMTLLGWGVRKMTFIDCGRVSPSNVARHPLFGINDCLNGGLPKAAQAAKFLKQKIPTLEVEGVEMEVPMLGHLMINEAGTRDAFLKLRELIESHDAIFLLLDSREARWLPTVMGKAANKIVMTAAIGFDSYVVLRHGAEVEGSEKGLGCYFCNDVVAPEDSMKDQTLDQQCTVSRSGVSPLASLFLVELLASLLQHPLGNKAPAPIVNAASGVPERDPPNHPLGLVPHQLRGWLSTFQQLVIRGEAYPCCSACGPAVLGAYRKDGWEFVKRALTEKDYVAELSGLAEVQRQAEKALEDVEWEGDDGDGEGELL